MLHRLPVLLVATVLLVAACGGGGATTSPAGGRSASPGGASATAGGPAGSPSATAGGGASPSGTAASPTAGTVTSPDPNDLLAKILERGTLRVSTDPEYPPQSFLRPDGTYEGFDIDVANEIGRRLGVKVAFEKPNFDQVVAGGWAGRWDISVGSVTITAEREAVLDFTEPYYFTPAQLAARKNSGITSIEGFAGKTVCVGAATTYFQWLQGQLQLAGGAPEPVPAPQGVKVTTRRTDTDCVADPRSGEGWLSSSTTVATALKSRQGQQYQVVGEPVFYEPLAVATDKRGPAHAQLQAELDRIVSEMHQDGTLSTLSKKWFDGLDLTKAAE